MYFINEKLVKYQYPPMETQTKMRAKMAPSANTALKQPTLPVFIFNIYGTVSTGFIGIISREGVADDNIIRR